MMDALIVGFGLSGVALAHHLEQMGKKVCVIDANKNKASLIAAGLYNPVILKRFTMAWNANKQLEYANEYYAAIEEKLQCSVDIPLPIYRKFNTVEEQNKWSTKSNAPILENFLDDVFVDSVTDAIKAPFKYGKLNNTGRINVKELLDNYIVHLKNKDCFLEEEFKHSLIEFLPKGIQYKNIKAKRIIFCEGFGLHKNPFFNYLPLIGSKGCYLIIKSKDLKLNAALKSHFFMIPLGNDQYKFGATFEHTYKGINHDKEAKEHLITELEKLIEVSYQVVDFQIGIRPTVKDRRPLIGQHPAYKQLFVFNGMGTRGILIAPTSAKQFCVSLLANKALPEEVDIKRFSSLWKGHNS